MNERAGRFPLRWTSVSVITAVHAAALLGFLTFSWRALTVAAVLWWITGSLGIGLGFHRYLTHKGFSTSRWVERFLVVCGTLAVQGGPISWVSDHRCHHAHSDRDLDPHNSRRGFWWAHIGWIFHQNTDSRIFENYRKHAKDIADDAFLRFLDRWYIELQVVLGLLLLVWGGWSFAIWGIFVRLVFGWHCTWLVNSAAHKFGYQSYDSGDESRNCWWVALLAFGEGWHNNHHVFPRSARHGLRWWEFDSNYLMISVLRAMGLVWDVKVHEHERRAREVNRGGAGMAVG